MQLCSHMLSLFEQKEGSRKSSQRRDLKERCFLRRHSGFSTTQTSECECKYSDPVLCQLQSDIFTAFSHAYHSAHPPCLPPPSKVSQCPHCTHTNPAHIYKPASTHARTTWHTHTHTHKLHSGEALSQDLWQCRLGVQLFLWGAEAIECLTVYLLYPSCFALIKRNNENLLNRQEDRPD